jgi:cell division protein FtsL
MSAIAEAPLARKGHQAAEAPVARKARRAPAAPVRSRAPFAGGVAWIALIGVLLAGIVAVNVLVLQLNMQFDGLSRERAQLKADNARLRSQLSSASANVRIEEAATAKLGLRAADPLTTTYVRLGER